MGASTGRGNLPWRVLASIVAIGAYVVAFPFAFEPLGDIAGALAVAPAAVVAGMYGLGAGLLFALVSGPVNLLMIDLVGAEPTSALPIVIGATLALMVAAVVGKYHDLVARLRDIERDNEHARRLLHAREADLEHVVTTMPVVVFRVDHHHRFVELIGGGLDALGVARDELVGSSIDRFFGIEHPGHPILNGLEGTLEFGETTRFDATWSGRSYTVKIEPTRGPAGEVTGALGIAIDVSAQYRQQAELERLLEGQREATERLATLNDMKDGFLQAVSHELRTPLTTIRGFVTTLRRHRATMPEDAVNVLFERLLANADRLDHLLNDLLDVDRLGRGIVEPRRTPVEVGRMACELADNFQLGSRPLTLQVQDVTAWVDGPKVSRIIENLLGNAVKHTPDGTRLTLVVADTAEGVYLEVRQEGVSVPDDLKNDIFEPFRQGPLLTDHQPGTGIGLSLVAKFAEIHGGRAWVEDREQGGAAFCVLLPAESVEAPHAAAPSPANDGHDDVRPVTVDAETTAH